MGKKPVTPANSGGSAGKRKPPIGRRFKKGESGNPAGRPPLPPGYKEAFDVLEPMSWKAAEEILADPKHKDRAMIARYIIDRRRGTPTHRSEITGQDGKPIEVTGPAEVIAALKQLVGEGQEG